MSDTTSGVDKNNDVDGDEAVYLDDRDLEGNPELLSVFADLLDDGRDNMLDLDEDEDSTGPLTEQLQQETRALHHCK
jgi:hypothetical protein